MMHPPSFEDYLLGERSIRACLQEHRSPHYLVSPQALWVDPKHTADPLTTQARTMGISVQTLHPGSGLNDEVMHDLKRHHFLLTVACKRIHLSEIKWNLLKTILVLDHLTDVQNLGSILRSACVFGVDLVIYPKHGQAHITPRVRTIAQGAAERVPCIAVSNLNQFIHKAQEEGFWIYGFAEQGAVPLGAQSFSERALMIIGSEGAGIRQHTLKLCDFIWAIPSETTFSCLNAASAASIVCYERHRQQRKQPRD